MKKKSLKLLSEAIQSQMTEASKEGHLLAKFGGEYHIRNLVENLATILKLDNSKFDRDKFLKESGF